MAKISFPAEWTARWITPEKLPPLMGQRSVAAYLRKAFTYEKTDAEPVLFATAHGVYQIKLNGERIAGNEVLAPFSSDFSERLQVQSYPLGSLLREGENTLEVLLADGSWRGSVSTGLLKKVYGCDVAFFAELKAGEESLLLTDADWEAMHEGALFQNDPILGEVYDARYEEPALYHLEPVWEPVRVLKRLGTKNFVQAEGPAIAEHETYAPVLMQDADGSTLLDFGKKLAGYVRVQIPADVCYPGEPLVMTFGEALSEAGSFIPNAYLDPDTAEMKEQGVHYICRKEANDYRPASCWFGFRYVKLETTLDVKPEWFSAVAVYTDFPFTAEFSCGSDEVNALFAESVDRLKHEFVGLPTEGKRRIGCAAHAQLNARSALFLADCAASYRDWLADYTASQDFLGNLPGWAPGRKPSLLWETPAGFADAVVLIPAYLYQFSGNTEAAEACYESAKKWLSFRGKCIDRCIKKHKAEEREAAYRFLSLHEMAGLAEALGHDDDVRAYAEAAAAIREDYRACFLEGGRVFAANDGAYVRPLVFGLLDRYEYPRVAQDLAVKLERNAFLPDADDFAAPDILRALADNGQADIAYRVLTEQGRAAAEAGTLVPASFLMDSVLGLRFDAGRLTLAPRPSRLLGHAEGAYESAFGRIESAWRFDGDFLTLRFSLPAGLSAELILPDGTHRTVSGAAEIKL